CSFCGTQAQSIAVNRGHECLLWFQAVGASEEVNCFANIGQIQQDHQQTAEAESKPAVRRAAVAEVIQVVLNRGQGQAFFQGLVLQCFVAVLALRAGGDFQSASK